MKTFESKTFVRLALVSLVVFLIFGWHLSNDPRLQNGSIAVFDLTWWEIGLFLVGAIGVVATWVLAVIHAIVNGKVLWGLLNFFLWPLSFFYAYRVAWGQT